MKETTQKTRTRTTGRTGTASQATAAETIALGIVFSIALTCVAIGAWSMLAFMRGLATYGAGGVLSGFVRAITG